MCVRAREGRGNGERPKVVGGSGRKKEKEKKKNKKKESVGGCFAVLRRRGEYGWMF